MSKMKSINLEMEDIYDREGSYDSDEDIGQTNDGSDAKPENDDDDVAENLKKLAKKTVKTRVTRPQIKLDVDRLRGPRGLSAIPKIFKDVKFKGKGHEAQDLELLMSNLEHWGHRLMPKMPFDDFVERLEKIGSKKEMQTCIKRIRMDLPLFSGDAENEEERVDADVSDIFNNSEVNNSIFPTYDHDVSLNDSVASFNHSTIFPSNPVSNSLNITAPSTGSSLTQEQKERIEKNKQLALQKRLQRSLILTPTPSTSS